MNPMFFGQSVSPLFGVYHPPIGGSFLNKAVLVCSPIAQEHNRSYKPIRNFAKLLSNKGYHVLRFDFSGVGDSFGDLRELKFTDWLEDVSLAYNELVDISGVKKVSVFGVRLGGTLAVLSDKYESMEKVVLWEPIQKGGDYVVEMKNMHQQMLVDEMRFNAPRDAADSYENEMLGHIYNKELINELSSVQLDITAMHKKDMELHSNSENLPVSTKKSKNKSTVYLRYEDDAWTDVKRIGDMLLTSAALTNIADEF